MQNESKCMIWETEAQFAPGVFGDYVRLKSNRAGGWYEFTTTASLATLTHEKKIALSNYILEANLRGHVPQIDRELIHHIEFRKKPISEKLNQFLRASYRYEKFGEPIFIEGEGLFPPEYALICIDSRNAFWEETELAYARNLYYAAASNNWFTMNMSHAGCRAFQLNIFGEQKVEELGGSSSEGPRIFVAMWFGTKELRALYDGAIAPAIREAGYEPVRIDDTEHNEMIDDQIIAEIRRSHAVVVDLTCGLATPIDWSDKQQVGAPRGGVYYEAGFAKGLGIPVIWTLKQELGDIDNVVHFDVRQYNQIRWTSDHGLFKDRLRNRIEATLGRGPNN